ncbi:hypothetical protein KPL70_003574 [Citrus sinensis]|nr:hypothetical protein KPL70_003574 [Citrus sinensis]
MAISLPPEALTKKTFPFNKNFSSVYAIQEFAKKALLRFFMKAYLVTEPFPFSSFHPENLFLTGLTLDPSRETTEDVLWYIWCLTVLYATKLVLPITPTLEHLLNLDKATSLTWTLLEWFSPIPWWRKKLQQLSEVYNLERMPTSEAQMFTSVFIIHRPYFQHPDTKLFWTQDQALVWSSLSDNKPRTFIWRRENFSFMASTSSSLPVTLSSTLSLPRSCTSHTTNKIENLVKYSYIPESAQMNESSYPLISPYQLYKRPSSFTRSIRTLISTRRPHPKEYIQSSRLDQCALQATSAEQYVTLEIPSELLSNWKREGSVLLTFYPNFNLSLQDRNLPRTLKVQVQIQGAEQISSAKIATLHHQLVYRLQNHALGLPTPEHDSDTLMVLAESDQIPTIFQIPRQIPRHELIKLMPLEWISNYEYAPQEPPRLSFTYSSMLTAVQTAQENLPITGFNSEGYPVYPAKQNGHFLWDAPGSGMCDPTCPCWDNWDEDDDYATTRKKKPKKKKPPVSCHHYDPKPPQDPPPLSALLPFYQKELKWIAKHCKSETPSPLSLPKPPLACMMFSSTPSDYSSSFPPLDTHTDPQRNVVSKPFVPSPITSSSHLEPPKPFESVLNWQTQNTRAQNDTLLNINSKVENIRVRTEQLETKVDSISA